MSDEESKSHKFESRVERNQGRLHRVRSTVDDSGKVIHQSFSPLLVEFRFQDFCETVVGALVLAIPVEFTEEVWRLGEQLPWPNVIAVVFASITFVALFVYVVFYQDHLRGHVHQFLFRTIGSYLVALTAVAVVLMMFQKLPWQTDPATAIRRIIIVGFPACFSATVVDSLK